MLEIISTTVLRSLCVRPKRLFILKSDSSSVWGVATATKTNNISHLPFSLMVVTITKGYLTYADGSPRITHSPPRSEMQKKEFYKNKRR